MQVTDEEKKALLGGAGYFNDYVIKFPSVTITNETIHQESVSIKQAITGDGDLEFGGCIASTFEFEVSEVLTEELKGQEFTTELLVNNGNAARVKMGSYIAETVTQVDDNDYKKVVGYDAFYKMQDDVSDWYNSFFSNITQTTLKNFRQSLLLHFGVESEVQSLPNDNMIVTKTIDTTSNKITGQALLKMTCVLAGGFGIINRDGKFEIIYLTSEPLYPEENLYPEETLYPEDGEFEYIGLNEDGAETFYPEYRSVTYEEYNVERISCLILKTNKSSITATIGTDTSNPYIISGNYLLYGKTTEELNTIGNNIVNKFTSVVGYRPCDITTDGMAWLDIGSQIALEKKNDDIVAYLFSRELKGIQALTDTISAKGNKYRDNQTSVEADIEDLKNKDDELDEKTDEISDSIDEVSGNLDDLAEKTTVSLKKTEDSIEAEVTRASNAEGELSGRITVTADAITQEATRAKGAEETLSGRITVTADQITQEVTRAKAEEATLSGRINVTAEQITAEVKRAEDEENSIRTALTLKADSAELGYYQTKADMTNYATTTWAENQISSKVSKGDVCSEINQSSDEIVLKSNRLVIESSQFSLDKYGNASFSGELSAVDTSFNNLTGYAGWLKIRSGFNGGGYAYIQARNSSANCYIESDKLIGDTVEAKQFNSSTGYLKLHGYTSAKMFIFNDESYGVTLDTNANRELHLRPNDNGSTDCGSVSYKWRNLYCKNGTIQTSDRNEKMNIVDMSEQYANALIDGAEPKTYMMLNNESGRTHAGMIAQDLEQQLINSGMSSKDFAGFIKYQKEDENGYPIGEYGYGIRYEEFIAPLIKYTQCLKRDLKQEIERNQQLQFQLLNLQGEFMILKQQILGGK